MECHNCHEKGHFARDCPSTISSIQTRIIDFYRLPTPYLSSYDILQEKEKLFYFSDQGRRDDWHDSEDDKDNSV